MWKPLLPEFADVACDRGVGTPRRDPQRRGPRPPVRRPTRSRGVVVAARRPPIRPRRHPPRRAPLGPPRPRPLPLGPTGRRPPRLRRRPSSPWRGGGRRARTRPQGARGRHPRPVTVPHLGAGRARRRRPPAAVVPSVADRVGRSSSAASTRSRCSPTPCGARPTVTARAIVISGEPGIGKTRLAEEIVNAARPMGMAVAWARCPESAATSSFFAITEVAAQLEAQGVVDLTGRLGFDAVTEDSDRIAIYRRTTDVLRDMTRPAIVVLDDLQWADPGTLRLVEFIAGELRTLPIALVVTTRPPVADSPEPLVDCLERAGAVGRRACASTSTASTSTPSHSGSTAAPTAPPRPASPSWCTTGAEATRSSPRSSSRCSSARAASTRSPPVESRPQSPTSSVVASDACPPTRRSCCRSRPSSVGHSTSTSSPASRIPRSPRCSTRSMPLSPPGSSPTTRPSRPGSASRTPSSPKRWRPSSHLPAAPACTRRRRLRSRPCGPPRSTATSPSSPTTRWPAPSPGSAVDAVRWSVRAAERAEERHAPEDAAGHYERAPRRRRPGLSGRAAGPTRPAPIAGPGLGCGRLGGARPARARRRHRGGRPARRPRCDGRQRARPGASDAVATG